MKSRLPATITTRSARAFSLVEVLIAVLVLSLGLLGLGAVFPMVMREQRIATETTLGISARNAVEQMLFSRPDFDREGGRGWEALRKYVDDNGGNDGDWVAVEPDDRDNNQLNTYLLEHPDGSFIQIPLAQRLYPLPYSTNLEPRFVWDLAARMTDPRNPDTSPLIVALFMRPIDPSIKTTSSPANNNEPYSIVSVLIDPDVPARERRNPVSIDRQGRPTLDGRRDRGAQYAKPIVAEAAVGPGISDPDSPYTTLFIQQVVEPTFNAEAASVLIAASGQQFLDRRGHLFTVDRSETYRGLARAATFSPPMTDVNGDGSVDPDDYNPIVFLPQATSVEPLVFTINP